MARLSALYTNTTAQTFRAAIRPSLVGNLKYIERDIAVEAATELGAWLVRVVQRTLATMELNDRRGEVAKQLRAGIRIYGRSSLIGLRGVIMVYPWLRAQEFGGRIQSARGSDKYMAIPIFYGVRADGSPKFQNPRSWKRFGSFVYTQRGTGKKFLAYRSKETRELRILYILVDHIELEPALGLISNAGAMIGQLLAVWGRIYLTEALKPQYKIFNLWDGAYK